MPTDMRRYPDGWSRFSWWVRFVRARLQCECQGECGKHHGRRCNAVQNRRTPWFKGPVHLAVHHACRCDPPCANQAHVRALCQVCHLLADQTLHLEHRMKQRSPGKGGSRKASRKAKPDEKRGEGARKSVPQGPPQQKPDQNSGENMPKVVVGAVEN